MLNQVTLSGNLGGDPEMFYSSDGKPVASFRMAFRGSKKAKTGWIKVTCFNHLAEISEKYLHKGARIALTGSLDADQWKTDTGQARTSLKLLANTIEFIKTDGRGFEEGQNREDIPI